MDSLPHEPLTDLDILGDVGLRHRSMVCLLERLTHVVQVLDPGNPIAQEATEFLAQTGSCLTF
jgi:hypothetical protein